MALAGDSRTSGAVRAALQRRLGADTRALAAFRIAVGGIILADLLLRARYLSAFYTDAGALPREASARLYPTLSPLSIHALSGEAWLQWLLFAVAGGLAVLLVVGYRTRFVAVGSWLLLASLQFRNYLVLNGGDTVLLVALFLALFVPLGERWSLDALAAGESPRRRRVVGFASAALLSQVTLVYATNAVFKLRSDAWLAGDAVRYVYRIDRFTVLLGDLLACVTPLLVAVNWAWLALLVASPLLLVATGRARTALVGAFAAAHVGMALTMDLGFFPHVMGACLLLFLPPSVWDRAEAAVQPLESALRERTSPDSRLVHSGPLTPARVRRAVGRVLPVVTATVLVVGLLWQAAAVGVVSAPAETPVDPEEHSWKLFAPNPPTSDGYFVITGTLSSGAAVDLHPHADTRGNPPDDTAATYPSMRWRKYLGSVRQSALVRRQFADYLCRRGADRHGEPVERVRIEYVSESIRLGAPNEPDRSVLGGYRCPVVE